MDNAPHNLHCTPQPPADEMPPVELRTPRRSEREEMMDGKLYNPADPELSALRERAGDLCTRFNALPRGDHEARAAVLDELLPHHGEDLDVLGPVFFDYGVHTTMGDRVFANFNFTVLDCAPVTIGEGCVIGAGAVATKDIPPHSVAVGNPARVIRTIADSDASALQDYAQ